MSLNGWSPFLDVARQGFGYWRRGFENLRTQLRILDVAFLNSLQKLFFLERNILVRSSTTSWLLLMEVLGPVPVS